MAATILNDGQAAQADTAIEDAKARASVVAMTALVDARDWQGVARYFAPEVRVDYTSLFPGKPETLGGGQLVARWQGLIPGFDATRHVLSDVEIKTEGLTATGSARLSATHWIGRRTWTTTGRYMYGLNKIDGQWRISSLTYVNEQEAGDKTVVEAAAAKASGAKNKKN